MARGGGSSWSARRARRRGTGAACLIVLGALGCGTKAAPPSAAPTAPAVERRSGASDRQRVALTVYNTNFALVREERVLSLDTGRVALAYEDVSAQVQPETVHLRSLDDAGALTVLEQNYRYDLLAPRTLLEKYVGQRLQIARYDAARGREERLDAELLAVENGPVLRIGDDIVTAAPGRFVFPRLPPDLLERPTLVWLLDSARAQQRSELTYLTGGLSWHADYVLVLDAGGERGVLTGWVTLDNQSGTSFTNAELALVAGDVQRVQPQPPPAPEMDVAAESAAAGAGFQEQALFEYHLYTLERPTDVLDREQKQVGLFEPRATPLERKLVLHGDPGAFRGPWTSASTRQKLSVQLVLDNGEQNGLGIPLPAGMVRVYTADSAGDQQFVGEDAIDHTPRDEKIELSIGSAFDVVGERRQTAFRVLGRCASESSWAIELRSHRDGPARVEVIEPVQGDYQVLRPSHPFEPRDSQSFAFTVEVPGRGAVEITYQVRVRWC